MTTGSTENIEAYWKLDWDYIGWTAHTGSFSFAQKDWNQTLITRINQMSAQIYQKTQRGTANRVKMHPIVFAIVRDFGYCIPNGDGTYRISTRYDVTVDDKLPIDKLYVIRENYPMEPLIHDALGAEIDRVFVTIHADSPQLEEYKAKALENDKMQLDIVEPSMLIGEITIRNNRKTYVNPITGEITITNIDDAYVEQSQQYFIPGPERERTQEDIDGLIERCRHLVQSEKMPNQTTNVIVDEDTEILCEEARTLTHNINDKEKRVFKIPVGEPMNEEQARSFVQKITNLFKTGRYE